MFCLIIKYNVVFGQEVQCLVWSGSIMFGLVRKYNVWFGQEVSEAYEVLSDETKRGEYDRKGCQMT